MLISTYATTFLKIGRSSCRKQVTNVRAISAPHPKHVGATVQTTKGRPNLPKEARIMWWWARWPIEAPKDFAPKFDSRPLKVRNRPLSDLRIESAIRRWKDLNEGYKFDSDLVAIRLCSRELWAPKVPGLQLEQFRDNFGTPTWESREKSAIRVQVRRSGTENTKGRMVVAPPESGPWCVLWSKVPVACPNTQGCSRM
jgi:hypothetical protein